MNIEWPARQWILILVPPGCPMFLKAIADVGALGLVDLTVETLESVLASSVSPLAVRVDKYVALPECISVVVLSENTDSNLASQYRESGLYVVAESASGTAIPAAHAILVRGDHGTQTVARVAAMQYCDKPIFARGGLDRRSLAAARKAGAAGFVFAESFWLLPECDLSVRAKQKLASSAPDVEISIGNKTIIPGVDVKLAIFVVMRAGSLQNAIDLALFDAQANMFERLLGASANNRLEIRGFDRPQAAGRILKRPGRRWKTSPRPNSIAVIGVGAVLPKARNVTEFWSNVKARVDAVTEVPECRWRPNSDMFYNADPMVPDKTYAKTGGFVDGIDFDPRLFKIPPKVAEHIDDPQKWVLIATTEALVGAGYCKVQNSRLVLGAFDRQRTAVILGNSMGGELKADAIGRIMFPALASLIRDTPAFQSLDPKIAQRILDEAEIEYKKDLLPINQHSLPGSLPNIITGRVAATFDLHGTNCIIDAACSSSFAALDFAIKGLRSGEHDLVICGGVDQTMEAVSFVSFAKVGALSPKSCRPFDRDADGLIMGEGAGVFLLRRLEDAIRDGDQILAVIRGIGSSSDGAGEGITAPNEDSQEIALRRAYEDTELSPVFIELIEAHGTGTQRGDVAEINVLNKVYSGYDLSPRSVAIGSVKSQIGHLKAGAGAVGLIKTVLALHDKVIPPSIHFDNPNPEVDWYNTPFYVATELADWPERNDGEPRRAAVSAFGFGGTNYHAVLEEYVPEYHGRLVRSQNENQWSGRREFLDLAFFSGDNPNKVARILRSFAERIRAGNVDVATLAGESRAEVRTDVEVRCALVISSHADDAIEMLSAAATEIMNPHASGVDADGRIFLGYGPASSGKIAFLFPGQGSQYANMGRRLAAGFPDVHETLAIAERQLLSRLGPDISRAIGPGTWNASDQPAIEAAFQRTEVLQPAMVAVEVAVCRLLMKWGIHPRSCAGHSLGEFSALVAASSLSYQDALTACFERGRSMANIPEGERGCMASIKGDSDVVAEICQADDSLANVFVANLNGPRQTVIAGSTPSIEQAILRLNEAGLPARKIPVSHAFHTGFVAAAQQPLGECLKSMPFKVPSIPIISNVTADYHSEDPDQIRRMLVAQVVSPVRWQETIERLHNDGHRIFIEVGPRSILSDLVRQTLPGDDVVSFSALPNQEGEAKGILAVAARLFCCGMPIKLPQRIAISTGEPQNSWYHRSDISDSASASNTGDLSKYKAIDQKIRDDPLWPDILRDVREILAKITGYEPVELGLDRRLGTDLHLDSLDLVESFMEFDEQFDLPQLEREDLTVLPQVTIGMLVDWITAYKTGIVLAMPAQRKAPPRSCRRLAVRWQYLANRQYDRSLAEPVHIVGSEDGRDEMISLCTRQGIETTGDATLARSILCSPMAESPGDFDAFLDAVRNAHPLLLENGTIAVLVPSGPWGGAYCGFLKALQNEMPSTRCTALRNASAEQLLAEVRRTNGVVEMLRRDEEFMEAAYEHVPAKLSSTNLQAGDVVLFIGGARGIGAACATGLATEIPELIFMLAGRTDPEDAGVQQTLNALREAGASPFYEQVDITVRADCERLIPRAESLGALRLVVHAAGIQDSRPFVEKSQEIIRRTLAPKTEAVRRLVELATRSDDKPRFLFFGSTAARFGNINQTDYAAANEFLAHFAYDLRNQGIRARTLVWAPWSEIGMAAVSSNASFLKQIGVELLTTEEGVRAFVDEALCDDEECEIVLAKGLGPVEPFPDSLETWVVSSEDWFLADHRIGRNSEAILPGVMTVNRFCQAGNGLSSSSVVEVTDMQWLIAVGVDDDKTVELTVRVRADDFERTMASEMWLETKSGSVVAQAKLRFGTRAKPPTESLFVPDSAPDSWQVDGGILYEHLLTHGKSFQVLRRAWRTKLGVTVAELVPAGDRKSRGVIDPVALEGAFQTASYCHALETGLHCIPVSTGRIIWYDTNTSACYAAARPLGATEEADGLVFDLELIDKHGSVVARCEHYRVRNVGDPIAPYDVQALTAPSPVSRTECEYRDSLL